MTPNCAKKACSEATGRLVSHGQVKTTRYASYTAKQIGHDADSQLPLPLPAHAAALIVASWCVHFPALQGCLESALHDIVDVKKGLVTADSDRPVSVADFESALADQFHAVKPEWTRWVTDPVAFTQRLVEGNQRSRKDTVGDRSRQGQAEREEHQEDEEMIRENTEWMHRPLVPTVPLCLETEAPTEGRRVDLRHPGCGLAVVRQVAMADNPRTRCNSVATRTG